MTAMEMTAAKRNMRRGVVGAFLVLLVGLLIFALWGWLRDEQYRDLASLPPETRVGVYQRTMENLTTVCGADRAPRLEAFCREQAELALRMPECDAACQEIARPLLVYPTR